MGTTTYRTPFRSPSIAKLSCLLLVGIASIANSRAGDYDDWAELVSFRPPEAIQRDALGHVEKVPRPVWSKDRGYYSWFVQRIEDGYGPVNLDYFPVHVEHLPLVNGKKISAEQFLRYLRYHLNDLTPPTLTVWEPYNYRTKNRALQLGAYVNIDLGDLAMGFRGNRRIVPEEGTVVLTDLRKDRWIFSTVYTRAFRYLADGGRHPKAPKIDVTWGAYYHPVSGNREFGFKPHPKGGYIFYTRGADRMGAWSFARYLGMDQLRGLPLVGGLGEVPDIVEGLKTAVTLPIGSTNWVFFQKNLVSFVNQNGGKARFMLPKVILRDWEQVSRELHRPTRAWIDSHGKGQYRGRDAVPFLHPINLSIIKFEQGLSRLDTGRSRKDGPPRTFAVPKELELQFDNKPMVVRHDLDLRRRSETEKHWVGFASLDANLSAGLSSHGGHAIVFLGRENAGRQMTTVKAYGYYPEEGSRIPSIFTEVPGRLVNDMLNGKLNQAGRLLVAEVNSDDAENVRHLMRRWALDPDSYQVWMNDCITFTAQAAGELGLAVPARSVVHFPVDFMDDLIALNIVEQAQPAVSEVVVERIECVSSGEFDDAAELVISANGHRLWKGTLADGQAAQPEHARWRMGGPVTIQIEEEDLLVNETLGSSTFSSASKPGGGTTTFRTSTGTGSAEVRVTFRVRPH